MARRISNYKRGYKTIDKMCGLFLTGSIVFVLYSMISYTNSRDAAELNRQEIVVHLDR